MTICNKQRTNSKYKQKIIFFFILIQFLFSCKSNKNIEFNENGIYGAFFNDKYKKIFVGNGKGELMVFDYNFKLFDKKYFAHGPVATCISSPDNEYMVNTSGDGTLYIWKIWQDSISIFYKERIHNLASMTCLFSPKMNYIVSTSHDSTIVILDWKNKSILKRLKSQFGTIRFAWFSYDDCFLFWADDKGYLYKTDCKSWKTTSTQIAKQAINCIVSNLNNTELITACDNGQVYVINFSTLKIKESFKAHFGAAFVAEYYDVNRKEIATSGNDGYITIWQKIDEKYQIKNKILAHNGPCCTLIYNDSCTQLLSGGQDGWLKIWNSKSFKLLKEINLNKI